MVAVIESKFSLQKIDKDKTCENCFIYEIADDIQKYSHYCALPFKGACIVFSWAEMLNISPSWLQFFADSKRILKDILSTFHSPNFFIKQIQLCHSVELYREETKLRQTTKKAKNVFYSFSSSFATTLKFPVILDRARLIDLSKISRALPSHLSLASHLVKLAIKGARLADQVWELGSLFYEGRAYTKLGKLHPQTVSLMQSSVMSLLGFFVGSSIMLAHFWSYQIPPLIFLSISTFFYTVNVVGKKVGAELYDVCINPSPDQYKAVHGLPA